MTEPNLDSIFVVISGSNPQQGKAQRLRQVRSHITKGQIRRIHEEDQQRRQRKRQRRLSVSTLRSPPSSVLSKETAAEIGSSIPQEVQAVVPFTNSPFLNADTIGTQMAWRVQQCKCLLRVFYFAFLSPAVAETGYDFSHVT